MSGIVSNNTDKQSGLIKTPVLGPDSGSSDPANDTNAATLGDRFINTTSGELFVATSVTTDTNAWVILTDVPNGLKHFERAAMTTAMDGDFNTGNVRYKARERYSFGVSDPLGAFGSPGAS